MIASRIAWITVAGSALLGASPAIAGTFYSITPLPFQPADLNNSGDVVGQQYLWRNGTLFDIRTFPGATDTTLNARGINDTGWIVGDGLRSDRSAPFFDIANNRGFVFNGRDITPIPPTTFTIPAARTIATDVNNQNQVLVNEQLVGTGVSGVTFRLEPDGSRTPLFQTARFGAIDARATNNRGQAVGTSLSSGRTGPGAAYLSDGTITTPLISSGYCSTFIDFIVPRCEQGVTNPPQPIALNLNDRGQVVGAGPLIRANDAPLRAIIWENPLTNPFGKDLGSFGQGVSEGFGRNLESIANGINTSGDVVGYAYAPNGERRAVLWQNGQLIDLNDQSVLDSSWKLTNALKINGAGQIIGIGSFNGQETGFLLSPEPIPEPNQVLGSSIAGVGMFLACLLRKRRSR
mgnify:CR=1 FL=1